MKSSAITLPFLLAAACCSTASGPVGSETIDDPEPQQESPTGSDCCEQHGTLDGKPDACAVAKPPKCIGCDGAPVLCQTACVIDGETVPCCLASGETVPCPEG